MSTAEARRVHELEWEVRELRHTDEISERVVKFFSGGARLPASEVVAFIDANRHDIAEDPPFEVELVCALLHVAPSTYHAAKNRTPSSRAVSNAVLTRVLSGPLQRLVESAQFTSIRYGERLAEIGATPLIGTVCDSYDNALVETVNAYDEIELTRDSARPGPGEQTRTSSW